MSLADERVTPRNPGLLARDLTFACHRTWRGKEEQWSMASYYGFNGEINTAERAIIDRIFELEGENKAQAIVIDKLTQMASRLQVEVTAALEGLRS